MGKPSLVIGMPVEVELIELVEPAASSGEAEEQWGFILGHRLWLIAQVLDGWAAPERKCVEVLVQDGRRFMLRHDAGTDQWTASAFVRPGETQAL